MGGRPEEGLTDAALCIARRPMGSDQGLSARPRRPCGRDCSRQSTVHRSHSLQISSRHPLAGSPGALWRLEDRASALQWAKSGVFERIFKLLASEHDNEYMIIDATIVRAHQHSAGARKKTASKRSADPAAD